MFDRYSESARQVIFFARCEAGILGSSLVEPEHLLLGLLRVDELLLRMLPGDAPAAIGADIEKRFPRSEVASRVVDLPLSFPVKCVLAYGAEESERLNHKVIEPGHLTLGLLHMEDCIAAKILRSHGIASDSFRSIALDALAAPPEVETARQSAYLGDAIATLENLVGQTRKHLKRYADSYGELPLAGKPWKRKEALGHLVDWAAAHQMWFARALTEPALVARDYPPG
jgi:ATP-dependent Clp protease ATP-binding subunit ClpC